MISGTKCAICADKHHIHWPLDNINTRPTESVFTVLRISRRKKAKCNVSARRSEEDSLLFKEYFCVIATWGLTSVDMAVRSFPSQMPRCEVIDTSLNRSETGKEARAVHRNIQSPKAHQSFCEDKTRMNNKIYNLTVHCPSHFTGWCN